MKCYISLLRGRGEIFCAFKSNRLLARAAQSAVWRSRDRKERLGASKHLFRLLFRGPLAQVDAEARRKANRVRGVFSANFVRVSGPEGTPRVRLFGVGWRCFERVTIKPKAASGNSQGRALGFWGERRGERRGNTEKRYCPSGASPGEIEGSASAHATIVSPPASRSSKSNSTRQAEISSSVAPR